MSNREIKFRAWDKNRLEVIEEWQTNIFIEYYGFDGGNRFDLMQYTGLRDKNGAEIYEGDIVHASGFGLGIADKNYWGEWGLKQGDDFIPFHDLVMEGDLGEIKGTIHENPELLEL